MSLAFGIFASVILLLCSIALWVMIALWLNGLPVDNDSKREYPWDDDNV